MTWIKVIISTCYFWYQMLMLSTNFKQNFVRMELWNLTILIVTQTWVKLELVLFLTWQPENFQVFPGSKIEHARTILLTYKQLFWHTVLPQLLLHAVLRGLKNNVYFLYYCTSPTTAPRLLLHAVVEEVTDKNTGEIYEYRSFEVWKLYWKPSVKNIRVHGINTYKYEFRHSVIKRGRVLIGGGELLKVPLPPEFGFCVI